MKIGIIDADLLERRNHRFPDLAAMKISGYYKGKGNPVELLFDYETISDFDRVYISKVFSGTGETGKLTEEILKSPNVFYGGTGFFYDQAQPLSDEIEHQMPDYHLYDRWLEKQKEKNVSANSLKFYQDYSVGFLTRGCFRHCPFCVNKNSSRSVPASPLEEFMDSEKKKLCFLDDNFLACSEWDRILESVLNSGKPFQFKQGLDIRIITRKQIKMLFAGEILEDTYFAFDDIKDAEVIENKLELLRSTVENPKARIKAYILCGYDRTGKWDIDFWLNDIEDCFRRIQILMKHRCLPYLMRYQAYQQSPFRGIYINLARWCNQPAIFAKKSFHEFCAEHKPESATNRYYTEFLKEYPYMEKWFHIKLKGQ